MRELTAKLRVEGRVEGNPQLYPPQDTGTYFTAGQTSQALDRTVHSLKCAGKKLKYYNDNNAIS